jgi:protein ImuB
MPILCACVPSYSVAVARVGDPALVTSPTLVVDKLERGRIVDCDGAAYDLGARIGMTLLQASACAREARVALDDRARKRALWDAALELLDAASPLVEDAAEGMAFLEMRGIEGGPKRWLAAVNAALEGSPLPFALALGPNRFVARAAAFAGRAYVAREEAGAFLAPLPLRVLDLDARTIERLHLFGVRTLGELAALPHGPFVRRFGSEAARWHARAHAIDETPLVPRPRALRIERTLYGEGTAEREDQLLFALRTLVQRVAEDLAFVGKRCGGLHLTLECENGDARDLSLVLAQPTAQATTIFDLVRARLEGTTLEAPVTGLRLGAQHLEDAGTELTLFAGSDPDPEVVGIALARLEAALGPCSTLRARVVDGYRYESRYRYEPFVATAFATPRFGERASVVPNSRGTLVLRLIAPRTISVVLSGGKPAFVGTPPRAVLDVAGPWRVDEAWWDIALAALEPHALRRDEYDVLLEDGTLARIACDDPREPTRRWTLRGTYD